MNRRRFERLCAVLDRRQADLTVLLDNVHKPHNVSAIRRSCDAVGCLEAHAWRREGATRGHHHTSGGTLQWLPIVTHANVDDAIAALRGRGMRLIAAHFSDKAVDFREEDYTGPVAIVLGAELDGVSPAAVTAADAHVTIPMLGMAASLNVSVAAALILYEAQRQRVAAGRYDDPAPIPDRDRRLFEWTWPKLARLCRARGVPYPPLTENGELAGPVPR